MITVLDTSLLQIAIEASTWRVGREFMAKRETPQPVKQLVVELGAPGPKRVALHRLVVVALSPCDGRQIREADLDQVVRGEMLALAGVAESGQTPDNSNPQTGEPPMKIDPTPEFRAAVRAAVKAVAPDLAVNTPSDEVSRVATHLAEATTGDATLENVTSMAALLLSPHIGQNLNSEGFRHAAREAIQRRAGQPATELDLGCFARSAPPAGTGAGAAAGNSPTSRDDEFRAEFRRGGGQAALGITEAQYVASRRIDEGLESLT